MTATRWLAGAVVLLAPLVAAPVAAPRSSGPPSASSASASPPVRSANPPAEADDLADEPVSIVQRIANATTELDVGRARKMLEEIDSDSPAVAFERARLAIYLGDCDSAAAILSSRTFLETPDGAALANLAKRCAGAVAASFVVEDEKNGLWIRLQDDRDRALVPFITDVATRARASMARDLGVDLPRPLRIDLVRDLFTLSAITGLPVQAAETTGTIAVARWGRVTMVSPRATPLGFPWEDTLAHEITHLSLSRATRDHAPLWLQEGIAKRQEVRWRDPRPFDKIPTADSVARDALMSGRSVGVDKLGASIGMLPSPDAARIAFAEVESFVEYWLSYNGEAALTLLLADLKGVGRRGADRAMQSVTGYDLAQWIVRWKRHLSELPEPVEQDDRRPGHDFGSRVDREDVVRRVRLADLLLARGKAASAAWQLEPALEGAGRSASVRWRAARALFDASREKDAVRWLGSVEDISALHGGWFALRARVDQNAGRETGASRASAIALSVDPYREEVACDGRWTPGGNHMPRLFPGGPAEEDLSKRPPPPTDPDRRALCEAARAISRD